MITASTGSPIFAVAELKPVSSRACTTLPVGGGAPMSLIAPGFTASVPKFKGCNKFALKLVPASRYCGCTGNCARTILFTLCIFPDSWILFCKSVHC